MKAEDILKQEFIGLEIEVTDSLNRANIGIKGKIIDETKSTFVVATKKANKRLIKNAITFKTIFNNGINKKTYEIQGKLLQKRPHERIKTK